MKQFIEYIRIQDKVKLILYALSFPIYVFINNLIFNIVTGLSGGRFLFNDVHSFAFPCSVVSAETILFFGSLLKITLFISLIICHKKKFKFLTEILIIYFLFDFGQIGSMVLCDIINHYTREVKLNGFWYFESNFETLFTYFDYSMYPICVFWSLALGIFLWKSKRFSIGYFSKRFLIMPISGLTYGIAKYYFLYHFVWHK